MQYFLLPGDYAAIYAENPYRPNYPLDNFGGQITARPVPPVQSPVERDVVKTPRIPQFLLDIYNEMWATHPTVSMFQAERTATVHFDKAMICVTPDRIAGYVSVEAQELYGKTDDDLIKWNDTPKGPCFSVLVSNPEEGVRAQQAIDMLLRLHFTQISKLSIQDRMDTDSDP